ncbi:MAG: hypothetical protein ACQESG_06480 [Nanobdellota archaeon]
MSKELSFKKPTDAVFLVWTILRRIDCADLSTLQDRIRVQKNQYIAQVFGISPVYEYNLYLRGPYSPDLASDLFLLRETNVTVPIRKFASKELEKRFQLFKKFIQNKSVRELELIVTLHWLTKKAGFTKNSAKLKLKELKDSTDEEYNLANGEMGDLEKCTPN